MLAEAATRGVPENFPIFIGKHLCWSLFLTKLQAFKPILKNNCERLLLCWISSWADAYSDSYQAFKMKLFEKIFNGFQPLIIFSKRQIVNTLHCTKMNFSSFLRIWSHLLKKSLIESFIFCAVLSQCSGWIHPRDIPSESPACKITPQRKKFSFSICSKYIT